ncbi:unnamed protein product [Euphydryas editha]|uniref:Peptidase S1 domain-containing protein n=1 Tax=Euphydryas editha TaxID=104508 RepID=A0AAU9UGX8_EUPED|nr:unnamed protein product [Euphydryas editha]
MLKFFIFLIFTSYAVSKPLLEDIRIVGGEDVDITAAPYQVSILNRGRHSCGGSIIDNNIILTAAHCLIGTSPSNLQIRAGSSSSTNGGKLYPVGDLVWNPGFSFSKMDSDVAVIWLAQPLEYGPSIAPIDMFNEGEEIKDGGITVVTGWGNTMEGGGFPTTLQMALIPKVNEQICGKAYAPLYSITPRMMCAGSPRGGKDACQGDSGGPLVYNGKLAGIVSWGLGCARPNYPGVYAKVSALRSWIDEQIVNLKLKHVFRM